MLERLPEIGADLLSRIPQLGAASLMVRYQNGLRADVDPESNDPMLVGARILHALNDLVRGTKELRSRGAALARLEKRQVHSPAILAGLRAAMGQEETRPPKLEHVSFADLEPGLILAEAVHTLDGRCLLGPGHEISAAQILKLRNYARTAGIKEPILVQIPDWMERDSMAA